MPSQEEVMENFKRIQTEILPPMPTNDLSGKVVIVTGSNTGIGFEIAKAIATMGVEKLILAARSEERTLKALSTIKEETGIQDKNIEYMHLDLASFDSVRLFLKKFTESGAKLDILINNAGVSLADRIVTEDGWDSVVETNHLSTMLLTLLLTPTISYPKDPRIVTVSGAHSWLQIPWQNTLNLLETANNPSTFEPFGAPGGWEQQFQRYQATKLFNVLFAQELARRRPDIFSVAASPGATISELGQAGRDGTKNNVEGGVIFGVPVRPTVDGAKAIMYPAVADKPGSNGGYYLNCREENASELTLGDEGKAFAARLWTESVDVFKKGGFELEDWVVA
ncbi:hypothetical protein HDV00_007046 [Rhizophlyctis rosea]|nr:hypothetical protein HDV00_007046 [Rhizophlyctis rosea]